MVDIRKMMFTMMTNAEHLHIIYLIYSFRFLRTLLTLIFKKEICIVRLCYAVDKNPSILSEEKNVVLQHTIQ